MKRIQKKVDKVMRRFSRVPSSAPPAVDAPLVVRDREVITGDPFLPPELEREIFELAAINDPVDGWTHQHVGDTVLLLPQVCRRVQSWIEPFIYERVSLLQSFNGAQPVPKFLATVHARPASFFATHVKYLYMDYSVPLPVVQRIISVCTGVVSVGCHHSCLSLAHVLAPLPLQRLCVSEFALPPTPADLPSWTASLTQLGLSKAIPPDPAAVFAALPALTHLAVDYDALPNPDNPGMGAALARLLAACPHLRYLVLMTGSKTDYRWTFQRLREDGFAIGDPRFYVHLRPIPDGLWDAWSRRMPDVFVEAEEQLERRRAAAAVKDKV